MKSGNGKKHTPDIDLYILMTGQCISITNDIFISISLSAATSTDRTQEGF